MEFRLNYFRKKNFFVLGILLSSLSVIAQTSGGPDTFGYTWIDSDDLNGPTYNWIDITTTGTLVSGLTDDNSVGPISIPSFEYYGQTVNQIKIGSNGWISFDNISNVAHCFPSIPQPGGTGDNFLAPHMSDINFSGSGNLGEVYYFDDVINNRFIISYINVPKWINNPTGFTGSNTFQVVLDRNDYSIYFQYNSMDQTFTNNVGCNTDIVVGIENHDGTDGLLHSTQTTFQNNYTILFDSPYCKVLSSFNKIACESYTVPSGDETYTSSGIIKDTILALNGCDSIMTIDLTINQPNTGDTAAIVCDSFTWYGTEYTSSGNPTHTLQNMFGCDSVVTLDLTINTVDVTTTKNGFEISTNNTNATSYQWINCATDLPISGATNSTFTATENGEYKVEITEGNCSKTSECVTIEGLGINNNSQFSELIELYPNPTNGEFTITTSEKNIKVTVYGLDGKVILDNVIITESSKTINLNEVESGVYFVKISNSANQKTLKLIVE